MTRLLASALTLSALVLSGCGAYQTAAPGATKLMGASQQSVKVETRFLQLIPKSKGTLQAGDRIEVAARVAFEAPASNGTLRVYFTDAQGSPIHEGYRLKLQGRQGVTTAWVDATVPQATHALTLRATVEFEDQKTVGTIATQRFAVQYNASTARRREIDQYLQ